MTVFIVMHACNVNKYSALLDQHVLKLSLFTLGKALKFTKSYPSVNECVPRPRVPG